MQKAVHPSAAAMDEKGLTNGCVEIEPIELYWKPDPKEWTPSQLSVIQQTDLFATKEQMKGLADRVPWQFRLRYKEKNTGREDDGKVLAWSLYQGFRRVRDEYDTDEAAFERIQRVRDSIFNAERTVFAILGTHSRFGHWMISALITFPLRSSRRTTGKEAGCFEEDDIFNRIFRVLDQRLRDRIGYQRH